MNKNARGFVPGVWDMSLKGGNKKVPTQQVKVVIGAWGVMVGDKLAPSVFSSKAEAHALAVRLGPGAVATYLSIKPSTSYEESLYE